MLDLPVFTYKDIKSWNPCYDPVERGLCNEEWCGTAVDVLQYSDISFEDRLWVVLRYECLPKNVLKEFAIYCAESVLHIFEEKYPDDDRPRKAIEAAKAYLSGTISSEDAAYAAYAAARAARAARAAADAADAARAADAAARAARAAADAADAAYAAYAARAAAVRENQVKWLLDMLQVN